MVLQFTVLGEGPEVDLIPADSAELEDALLGELELTDLDVVDLVQRVGTGQQLTLRPVPDGHGALPEVTNRDHVLVVLREHHLLHTSSVKRHLLQNLKTFAIHHHDGCVLLVAQFVRTPHQ